MEPSKDRSLDKLPSFVHHDGSSNIEPPCNLPSVVGEKQDPTDSTLQIQIKKEYVEDQDNIPSVVSENLFGNQNRPRFYNELDLDTKSDKIKEKVEGNKNNGKGSDVYDFPSEDKAKEKPSNRRFSFSKKLNRYIPETPSDYPSTDTSKSSFTKTTDSSKPPAAKTTESGSKEEQNVHIKKLLGTKSHIKLPLMLPGNGEKTQSNTTRESEVNSNFPEPTDDFTEEDFRSRTFSFSSIDGDGRVRAFSFSSHGQELLKLHDILTNGMKSINGNDGTKPVINEEEEDKHLKTLEPPHTFNNVRMLEQEIISEMIKGKPQSHIRGDNPLREDNMVRLGNSAGQCSSNISDSNKGKIIDNFPFSNGMEQFSSKAIQNTPLPHTPPYVYDKAGNIQCPRDSKSLVNEQAKVHGIPQTVTTDDNSEPGLQIVTNPNSE